MAVVLFLDLSRSATGFAFDGDNNRPRTGVYKLVAGGHDRGRAFWKFGEWLYDMIGASGAEIVGYEAPIISGVPTGEHEAILLIGLAAITEQVAASRGVRSTKAAVSTVRKHFCGSGVAKKPDVVMRCRQLGYDVEHSTDRADAAAGWDYFKHTHDRAHTSPLALTGS